MEKKPRINPAAIDLLARVYNSHKKGLPEWMKNAREAYLRNNASRDDRFIILNYRQGKALGNTYLECIDFVGISGDEIEGRYMEWANPEAAGKGLKPGEAEGGQGNGGKAYLRQMFEKGFFVSVSEEKLSVVSFTDHKKYVLDFVPDERRGKDTGDESPVIPGVRKYFSEWLKAYNLLENHNITMVRGVAPTKPIDLDRLLEDIQQFPQARETVRTCQVHFYVNSSFRRELKVVEPVLHPAFQNPIKILIPPKLPLGGSQVTAARPPDFPLGELEICISANPLQGQALATWNRIDFHGKGVSVIGWKRAEELPLKFPQYGRYLFGRCTVPLLVDPKDNYELQGRVHLNEGPLANALYSFISEEADKLLGQLAKQEASNVATKKRKNLERLNQCLAKWIESKLTYLRGLSLTGKEPGDGSTDRKKKEKIVHEPPVTLSIHREKLQMCQGVSYQLRAVAYDAGKLPVPPGKVVWKSKDSAVVSVNSENGTILARSEGLATVTVTNETGLTSAPVLIQVHQAVEVGIKGQSPAKVSSNRRLQLVTEVKTISGRTLRDVVVSWRSSDERIATVGQDGWLVGGEVGDAEMVAYAGPVESEPLEVIVDKGAAGKPKGGGKGKPRILLSGQHFCPFDNTVVILQPTDPPVYQRPYKPDYDNNVFWINLQHPLADELLKGGEASVQWRTYHFQRLVDVYTILQMRSRFADSENLDVDQVLDEIHVVTAELYAKAKEEIFEILYNETIELAQLEVA